MKHANRIVVMLLVVFLVLALPACKEELAGEKDTHLDWTYVFENTTKGALSQNGYYYVDSIALKYIDFATRKTVVLCAKAGCSHGTQECDAFIRGLGSGMYYWNDTLYYTEGGSQVYSRNAAGGELKKVGVLAQKHVKDGKSVEINKIAVCEGYLYYVAELKGNRKEDTGTTVITTVGQCIGRLDLSTGKDEILVELAKYSKDSEKLILCAVRENGIIYQQWEGVEKGLSQEDKVEAVRNMSTTVNYYNTEMKETKTLFTKPLNDCVAVSMVADGKLYFRTLDSQTAYSYDLVAGTEELIHDKGKATQLGGGYLHCPDPKASGDYYLYDLNTKAKLPNEVDVVPWIWNISDTGFVFNMTTTSTVYYVYHKDLSDGLQESDLIPLYSI